MEVLHDGEAQVPSGVRTAVTIGAYDGIHRGHREVLSQLRAKADSLGVATAVVTFDVHPALVLRPENAPRILTNFEQRVELFEAAGVDYLYLVRFTEERARTDDDVFGRDVFVDALHAQAVVVGEDFHFGRARGGNVASLTALGEEHDFEVFGIELKSDDGATEPISSTAIRRSLAGGDVAAAAEMLGRPYEIRGVVIEGDQRGRTIGFPTANVPVDARTAWPADGVYAGWCRILDADAAPDSDVRHPCAINIGRRPTFHQHAEHSLLEAHLIDFSGDLYGKTVAVEFVDFLRSEHRFSGIDELSAQLKKDIEHARSILSV